jgi:HSP20 family protein
MLGELQPWFSAWSSPSSSVDQFRKEIDEVFDRFFGDGGYRGSATSMMMWPVVESFFKNGNWITRVDLPGVDPKDIDVSVSGNTLTIRASRERRSDERNQDFETHEVSYGRFDRSLTLPKGVKSDQISAKYEHGVLELTMPASPELAGRKIAVEIGTEEKKKLEHQAA